jgi:hypothetical protein
LDVAVMGRDHQKKLFDTEKKASKSCKKEFDPWKLL